MSSSPPAPATEEEAAALEAPPVYGVGTSPWAERRRLRLAPMQADESQTASSGSGSGTESAIPEGEHDEGSAAAPPAYLVGTRAWMESLRRRLDRIQAEESQTASSGSGSGAESETSDGEHDEGSGSGSDYSDEESEYSDTDEEGVRVPATTEMAAAAVGEEGGSSSVPPAGTTCSVCMEPWTCYGAHRICCIPCGHVYGRSCLERWLRCSGNKRAKCPQCGKRFQHKLIINLYAPENMLDGCRHIQDGQVPQGPTQVPPAYMASVMQGINGMASIMEGIKDIKVKLDSISDRFDDQNARLEEIKENQLLIGDRLTSIESGVTRLEAAAVPSTHRLHGPPPSCCGGGLASFLVLFFCKGERFECP